MSFLKKKKIGILILSRFFSKRLKNKAALKINNLTIIEILIERLLKITNRQNIIICTSKFNNNVTFYRKLSKKYKIKIFFGRELNVLNRIIKCLEKFNLKHFVRATGDNPFIETRSILPMCAKHIKNKCDYTFNKSLPRGTRVEVFSLNALKKNYKKIIDLNSTEYLSYFFLRKDLYKIQKINFRKYYSNQELLSASIDSKKDLSIIQDFFKKNNIHDFKQKELIFFLKKRKKTKKKNF